MACSVPSHPGACPGCMSLLTGDEGEPMGENAKYGFERVGYTVHRRRPLIAYHVHGAHHATVCDRANGRREASDGLVVDAVPSVLAWTATSTDHEVEIRGAPE